MSLKSSQKKIIILSAIFIFAFIFASFLLVKNVEAATSTLRGSAWWGDALSYVSFNCLDDIIGDPLDVEGNLELFHFYSAPCSNYVHKVEISEGGRVSGTAWNNNQGVITFDYDGEDPPGGYGSFNSVCPTTCNPSTKCYACYIEADKQIHGWAKIASSSGENAWIKLNPVSNPVKIQGWDLGDSVLPGHDILAGDLVGIATSSLGDLTFNCESEGTGNCASRSYKVYIANLQIGSMTAPNWTYSQACSSIARSAVLRWYKKSGIQSAYEIVVNDSNTFSTSTSDYVCWSGKKTSSIATQYILPNSDANCNSLSYNTNYHFWIRLYDENDIPTEWYMYDTNSATSTDGDPDSDSETFTTFRHEFPSPFFSWEPLDVLVGTSTLFTSNSEFYTDGSPNTPQGCFNGFCSYLWTTTDTLAQISDPTNATTSIFFFKATNTTVTLRVTDSDGYYCSLPAQININYDLPIWKEVKAE